jgi:ribonuclease HI
MSWLIQHKKPVIIYTDGSCLKNPGGCGGWAAVLVFGGNKVEEITGGEVVSTNNRMELRAAIEALKYLKEGHNVILYTDSQYVQKGITLWVKGWMKRGWVTKEEKPVLNKELWQALVEQEQRHSVSWLWMRGHLEEDNYNNRCDVLAGMAARKVMQSIAEQKNKMQETVPNALDKSLW